MTRVPHRGLLDRSSTGAPPPRPRAGAGGHLTQPATTPRAEVLVVDDDEAVLRAFARVFGRRYALTCVTSGAAALEALKAKRFDLVILDNMMPGMTGVELVRRLEVEHPEVPRIMLTGYPDLAEVAQLREGRLVSAVVMKPWEVPDLGHAIERALGGIGSGATC